MRNVSPEYPWWLRVAFKRPPDQRIGDNYLDRWYLIPHNRFFNVYLHHFMRSDDDRALHDHPWWNFSYLLCGRYVEHTITAGGVHHKKLYKAGDWKFRSAKYAHRVELVENEYGTVHCWSLFITGPHIRDWGFHCKNGWRKHDQFEIGGCGEV